MKKFVSLLLTAVLLATMVSVFAVPASAEPVVDNIKLSGMEAFCSGSPSRRHEMDENNVCIYCDCNDPLCEHENCQIVYDDNRIFVKCYCKTCNAVIFQLEDDLAGSTLSEGNLTIIVGVAAAVVFGLGGFILGTKKKKKPALASGENTDEE